MNKKAINAYLVRSEQIIGRRAPGKATHDDAIVEALDHGQTIDVALCPVPVKKRGCC